MKKFANPLPEYEPLFTSPDAIAALERTIALHYLRTGHFNIARELIKVCVQDIA
jgi:hypothetical protein